MDFTEFKKIQVVLVLKDFEKAFDSNFWSFISKSIDILVLVNTIQWVKILNTGTNFKAAVLQCGFLSVQLPVEIECRQWDPVAPFLISSLCLDSINFDNKSKMIILWELRYMVRNIDKSLCGNRWYIFSSWQLT